MFKNIYTFKYYSDMLHHGFDITEDQMQLMLALKNALGLLEWLLDVRDAKRSNVKTR